MHDENTVISSEQALDDYFGALLYEETESEPSDMAVSSDIDVSPLSSPKQSYEDDRVGPDLKADSDRPDACIAERIEFCAGSANEMSSLERKARITMDYSAPVKECELPNLADVERLLDQLESTNQIVESEFEQILAKNNAEMISITPQAPVCEGQDLVSEEIQDWDLEGATCQSKVAELEPPVELEANLANTTVSGQTEEAISACDDWLNPVRQHDFQVLYFDVNGVTFAVPLDELGGIHRLDSLNHLLGRPEWYLGLQTSREQKLDVVDSAKWAMPERIVGEEHKEHYQYIVMLGTSKWGLATSQLLGTESLSAQSIRWREQPAKRPWLAGMVTEKMCALIHVEAMINMLNSGLDVKSLN